jgi:hypothetical protein
VARSTATAEGASESFTYVPVGPAGRTPWTRRLTGFLGLLALIAASAAVLAGAVYEAGHLINQMIARYLEK